METIKKFKDVIFIVIIILLCMFGYMQYSKNQDSEKRMANYESAIRALGDSIRVSVKDGISTYAKLAPEIDINELTKSEYFKTLSADQQKFYNKLSEMKGLLAASNAKLEKQGEMIASLTATNVGGVIEGDSLKFKRGTELAFNEQDTAKKMQWTAKMKLDSNIDFKLDYKYKFDILTTFERLKDKSIEVKWNINDPDLKVTAMNNFIIPQEQKKTKFGRWLDKNSKVLRIVGGSALFVGGGYLGYTLAK